MAVTGARDKRGYYISHKLYPIDEVANDISNRLYVFDMDVGTNYTKEWTKEKITQAIRNSLEKVKDKTGMISEENRQKTIQAFGVIKRKSSTFPRIVPKSNEPYKISTKKMNKNRTGVGTLRRSDSTVFWDEYSLISGDVGDINLLKELDEDERLPKSAMIKVENKYNF